ncbi:GbsR/MarR family transcriptional regulator [Streptoalloteichus hindustanus]|uniref:MarR family protein n=1 Tax=Streptoalloteichus hindustanus TaxID=2017 RepID=A0A1M5HXU9_STRHI|nr:helix-turn-helix domain-containing protein [Streptoalloteichus hindustanus]SHG20831.1 MarR family protein [Streptoalloteichus hindustanus]
MAVGRLTPDDRKRIEAGLADGLPYAEIARRLGRPTSTVSREVSRNGRPSGYRADYAGQAAGWRARRNAPTPIPETSTDNSAHGRDSAAVRGYVDRFAAQMVRAGLPRMAARVLACLVTTDSGAMTAAELVHRLRVSPASVSKAVGYLEGLEVIGREREDRGRRERYVIDDDVWLRAWLASAQKNAMWAQTAREGANLVGTTTPAGARLQRMSRFFASVRDDMTGSPDESTRDDARTVLAAVVHAAEPLTAHHLATALDWPADRVARGLQTIERHPDLTDPLALRRTPSGAYAATVRSDRLTTTQRKALNHIGRASTTPVSHPSSMPSPSERARTGLRT